MHREREVEQLHIQCISYCPKLNLKGSSASAMMFGDGDMDASVGCQNIFIVDGGRATGTTCTHLHSVQEWVQVLWNKM